MLGNGDVDSPFIASYPTELEDRSTTLWPTKSNHATEALDAATALTPASANKAVVAASYALGITRGIQAEYATNIVAIQ